MKRFDDDCHSIVTSAWRARQRGFVSLADAVFGATVALVMMAASGGLRLLVEAFGPMGMG